VTGALRRLHSLPTRRSSDLDEAIDLLARLLAVGLGRRRVDDRRAAGDLARSQTEDVQQCGGARQDALPSLTLVQLGAAKLQTLQRLALLAGGQSADLHDAKTLQRAEDVFHDGAATYNGHLVHLGDHGRIFSNTIVAAASRLAATLAARVSDDSRADVSIVCLTDSSSLRPASASDCASASARARAASSVAAASSFALSTVDLALARASSTFVTSFFSWARSSCSRRSPCASKRPSLLMRTGDL